MHEVFVNYRTGDGDEAAALIERTLSDRFGEGRIFRAATSIPPGVLYAENLVKAVRNAAVLLAVMGPDWSRDPRLRNEDDWVRREIMTAYDGAVTIIPVLKGRQTDRLKAADLPPELSRLADAQSLRLDTRDNRADLARIGHELAKLVPALKAADRSDRTAAGSKDVHNAVNDQQGTSVQGRDFNGKVVVSGSQGAVHAGSGDMHFHYAVTLIDAKGRSPRRQAADELQWLWQRFVHPPGFGEARQVLHENRTVFLDGPPGSGRISAAKILLWELDGSNTENPHPLDPEKEQGSAWLNLDHIGEGDRIWLDLSALDAPSWHEIQRELPSLRATVHMRDAHLVVVLPHEIGASWGESAPYHVEINRPPLGEVLHRYLRQEDVAHPVPLPPLRFLETHHPLRDVPRYVQLVIRARDKGPGAGGFTAWCGAADRALSGREREVTTLMERLENDGPQRALLLVTAMLHGAPADSIHRASVSFLRTAEHPPDGLPMLQHVPFDRRLKGIGAELDSSGAVRFEDLDYDTAVRAYFWRHMPALHEPIRAWVEQTADALDLSDRERGELVERFSGQCLSGRRPTALTTLVEHWTAQPTQRRMKAAALVLQRGLRDDRHGRYFRRQIYEWACKPNMPDRLAQVIIVACRDVMAVSHPDEAVVRLHHVARREHGAQGREALLELVHRDRRFLRQMLARLTDTNAERKWAADTGIFLELADPVILTDPGTRHRAPISEGFVNGRLTEGWRLAFTDLPDETWLPRARVWLVEAARSRRYRNELLDVLITAGAESARVLARLYTITRETELCDVNDLVRQKIYAAQGLLPA